MKLISQAPNKSAFLVGLVAEVKIETFILRRV